MCPHVFYLSVDRDEKLRLCEAQHYFQLLTAGMSRDVECAQALVYNFRTLEHKLIYNLRNCLFVSGYW